MKTYTGGCHCGAVRYHVDMTIESVISCNCSICTKHGLLLSFVPANQFTLLTDPAVLTEYQFNKKMIHHLFCSLCGVESFAKGHKPDGSELYAINIRCLDGIDLDTLSITPVDGKSM